jgi:hypothetical protein
MKYYLSIDMDYFGSRNIIAQNYLSELIVGAKRKRIPINSVMNHQQLLPFVDSCNATCLVNVDEHSDLYNVNIEALSCGSWISYVQWRKNGRYLWIRKDSSTKHHCNYVLPEQWGDNGWKRHRIWNTNTDWNISKSIHISSIKLDQFNLRDCVGIGLSLSPDYTQPALQQLFRELVKEYSLPYKKGTISECRFVRKIPSK